MTATLKLDYKLDMKEATTAIKRLERAGGDTESVFIEIGEYMLIATDQRFENEVSPNGFAWPEILDSTRAKKRHPKILTESSRLRSSIVYQASAYQVEIGTNVVYAAIHQFGGKTSAHEIRAKNKKALFWAGAAHPVRVVQHPGSHIPAREFLGFSSQDKQVILDIVQDHHRRALFH